jgi:hypothetical protein
MWAIIIQFLVQNIPWIITPDLTPYYMMIIIGSLGFAAVFFYILYHIIKYVIQNRKKKANEESINEK